MPPARSPRNKFVFIIAVAVACVINPGADSVETSVDPLAFRDLNLAPAPDDVDGLDRLVRVDGTDMLVQTEDGDLSFLPGVNLGGGLPGSEPGEAVFTAEQYGEWFPQMAASGFRILRVDTLREPQFYQELVAYNEATQQGHLYLLHGIAVADGRFGAEQHLWDADVHEAYLSAVDTTVSAVNGQPGEDADHGGYTADAGPWIVGWTVEQVDDPELARRTDDGNEGASFNGAYFRATSEATPTEVFLAEVMDRVAMRQAELGRMVPVAFGNSSATDPLLHRPATTSHELVQVDANHIVAAESWRGGTFASYQADPYHPDFSRYDAEVSDYVYRGQVDPYAGYLHQLREHHPNVPVIVSRFGVPSGHAIARSGPIGRNQGGFDEVTQMAVNAEMLQAAADLGFAGGFLSSWIDEWHRTAPNTGHLEGPAQRRAQWMNAWAADAHSGLLASEPGERPVVVVDGMDDEWDDNGSTLVHEGDGAIQRIKAVHDEGWLYLSISLDNEYRLPDGPLTLGFDVIDGSGGVLPTGEYERAADYALTVVDGAATVLAAGHADAHRRLYGPDETEQPDRNASSQGGARSASSRSQIEPGDIDPDSDYTHPGKIVGFADGTLEPGDLGTAVTVEERAAEELPPEPPPSPRDDWRPQTLVVGEAPDRAAGDERTPVEVTVPGQLVRGTTDRDDPLFDSRATWQLVGDHLEVRLAWQGIGMADPARQRAYRITDEGAVINSNVERILITGGFDGHLEAIGEYRWEPWDNVSWRAVPKKGLELVTRKAESTLYDGLRPVSEPPPGPVQSVD